MVSITEVAPPSRTTVKVLGVDVEIRPVTGRMWAAIARRYPEVKRKLAGLEVTHEDNIISALESGPAIIAAGLGMLGDKETEESIDEMPREARNALLDAIMDLSFPPDPQEAARSSDAGPAAKSLSDPATTTPLPATTQDDSKIAE